MNYPFNVHWAVSSGLTLAGIGAASLSWFPGQVIVEVITYLTVQTLGVMVTHTPAVNLKTRRKGRSVASNCLGTSVCVCVCVCVGGGGGCVWV